MGWRLGAWELRWRFKANPPVECEAFVLVGWLLQGDAWYRFCDASPPYGHDQAEKNLARPVPTTGVGHQETDENEGSLW